MCTLYIYIYIYTYARAHVKLPIYSVLTCCRPFGYIRSKNRDACKYETARNGVVQFCEQVVTTFRLKCFVIKWGFGIIC